MGIIYIKVITLIIIGVLAFWEADKNEEIKINILIFIGVLVGLLNSTVFLAIYGVSILINIYLTIGMQIKTTKSSEIVLTYFFFLFANLMLKIFHLPAFAFLIAFNVILYLMPVIFFFKYKKYKPWIRTIGQYFIINVWSLFDLLNLI